MRNDAVQPIHSNILGEFLNNAHNYSTLIGNLDFIVNIKR